jgi:hypothetical protein
MFAVGIHQDMVAGRGSSGLRSMSMGLEEDTIRALPSRDCDAALRSLDHAGKGREVDCSNRRREEVLLAGMDRLFVLNVVLRHGLAPNGRHRCNCSQPRNRRRNLFDLVQLQSGLQHQIASFAVPADWRFACDDGGTCGKFVVGR